MADRRHEEDTAPRSSQQDIERLQTYLEDMRLDILDRGEDAVIGFDEAMVAHIIACVERKLCRTHRGYIGVVSKASEVEDHVFVLGNCPVPVVLFQTKDKGTCDRNSFFAVGHCYIDGTMDGEAVDGPPYDPCID